MSSVPHRLSDHGRTEPGGEAEEPAEAGADPPLEPSLHGRPAPGGGAAHAGQLGEGRPHRPHYLLAQPPLLMVLSGAGAAVLLATGPAGVGRRGRSRVHQSSGCEPVERKQEVQGPGLGHAGAAAAQGQQEGLDTSVRHQQRRQHPSRVPHR